MLKKNQKKLRIFFVARNRIPSFRANSINIMNTCECLGKLNHQVFLFASNGGIHKRAMEIKTKEDIFDYYSVEPVFRLILAKPIDLYHLQIRKLERLFRWILQATYSFLFFFYLISAIFVKKPDLIYTRSQSISFLFGPILKVLRIPLILELHDPIFLDQAKKKIRIKIEHNNFLRSDKIICTNNFVKIKLIQRGISPDKICVIPHGVKMSLFNIKEDMKEIRQKLNIPESQNVISYVGSLEEYEGVEQIIKTMNIIEKKGVSFLLMMVGGRRHQIENLKSKIESTIKNKIIFIGQVPHKSVPKYLAASDILVYTLLPERNFALPIKIFEYMASKKPIIAPNTDPIQDIIKNKETGMLINSNNPEEIAQAIMDLLRNKPLSQKISLQAYKKVRKNYTWKVKGIKIQRCISELAN